MLSLLLALFLGVAAGTLTGLIPGLHINLIATLLLSSSLEVAPLTLAVFIVAMAITHTFLDFIPSVFLGAPEPETALSVLPGHRLLLQGKGYGAVKLTLIGSYLGLLIALAAVPLFLIVIKSIYSTIEAAIPFILLAICGLLILKERKKFLAFAIFLLAGLLGLATLNFTLIKQPLLPLLSGLFGASLLSISFFKNVKLPKQTLKEVKVNKTETFRALAAGLVSSSLVAFLPAVGPAQAAVISTSFWKRLSSKTFLIVLGSINTTVMLLSFLALYLIAKPRTGAAVAIGKLLDWFSFKHFLLLASAALIAGSIAVAVTLLLAKMLALKLDQFNYRWLCFSVLLFISALTALLSGAYGLLVLGVATALGIVTALLGIKKLHLMGCLVLPVVVWRLA